MLGELGHLHTEGHSAHPQGRSKAFLSVTRCHCQDLMFLLICPSVHAIAHFEVRALHEVYATGHLVQHSTMYALLFSYCSVVLQNAGEWLLMVGC